MSLEKTIMQDMKEAMKAKDKAALRGIRAIKAALLLAKTDGSGSELDEAGELKILKKLVKQRKDSIAIFEKEGREDLAVVEREEVAIIEKYLPAQLSPEELKQAVQNLIEELGATSMKEMGKVIGLANQRFGAQAEGKAIANQVKALLS